MPLELMELLHNLKDHDFNINGNYIIDENEAKRVIAGIEDLMKSLKNDISETI